MHVYKNHICSLQQNSGDFMTTTTKDTCWGEVIPPKNPTNGLGWTKRPGSWYVFLLNGKIHIIGINNVSQSWKRKRDSFQCQTMLHFTDMRRSCRITKKPSNIALLLKQKYPEQRILSGLWMNFWEQIYLSFKAH